MRSKSIDSYQIAYFTLMKAKIIESLSLQRSSLILYYIRWMYGNQRYEQVMPELVPLQRKPTNPKSSRLISDEPPRSKIDQAKGSNDPQPSPTNREASSIKPPDLDRVASKRKDENARQRQQSHKKFNQLSRNLISQMIKKISMRAISQQNYPVSNQTIERLLLDLDEQIHSLQQQAAKFENSLALNPSNQHIKKQLQAVQKSLNQIRTIRELYHEKIDNRTKISDLEAKILQLKAENRDLKIKIARGIEKIESHIHNLPCQKEKQLIEEVNKYKLALSRQKEMRENLENNTSSIVLNFKRFYLEADEARKIVTQQLKVIKLKEMELTQKIENLNYVKPELPFKQLSHKAQSLPESSQPFLRDRKQTNRPTDQQNMADLINQIRVKQRPFEQKQEIPRLKQKQKIGISQLGSTILKREDSQMNKTIFNIEEQIKKMRGNQATFRRIAQPKH